MLNGIGVDAFCGIYFFYGGRVRVRDWELEFCVCVRERDEEARDEERSTLLTHRHPISTVSFHRSCIVLRVLCTLGCNCAAWGRMD